MLSILFEKAPDAIYLNDLKGTFLDGNEEAEKITGYKREELIGKSFLNLNLLSKRDIPKAVVNLGRNLLGQVTGPDDFTLNRKDGTQVIVEIRTYPFTVDGQKMVMGIARDITQRKQVESELLAETRAREISEERFRRFSESASESFVLFDSDLVFVYINKVGAERLGMHKDEVIGRHILDVLPQLENSGRYEKYLELLKTGEPQIFDDMGHFSGIQHLRINVFKVGEGLGLIATDLTELVKEQEERARLHDELVEERVRVEQAFEFNKLKTRLMSTATHEIRTPLSSIQGYTELIQLDEENLTDTQLQYFRVIQRNVRRLTKLTDGLLDVQRLEEGRTTLNIEPVKVQELLEDVENEFAPMLIDKDQSIQVSCVDVVVSLDRLRVMQVLVNLLSNASKFSSEGSVIVVDVVEIGEGVQFSVSDSGFGLRAEDIGKLFKPFPSIDRPYVTEQSNGLGLSISRGIVELHGGRIWVESDGLGKGSIFSFTIPNKK